MIVVEDRSRQLGGSYPAMLPIRRLLDPDVPSTPPWVPGSLLHCSVIRAFRFAIDIADVRSISLREELQEPQGPDVLTPDRSIVVRCRARRSGR